MYTKNYLSHTNKGGDAANIQIYKHIYQDSEMAMYTISKLLSELKEKDNKIKRVVEDILKQYEFYYEESKNYLLKYDEEMPENSFMTKLGAIIGIKKEVKNDNSDSSIAEMLIQGISMGSLEIEKKISSYEQDIDKKQLKFANNFSQFQQDSIVLLKKFL